MIRVVFDTNIVVAAVLSSAGPPARLLELALSGKIEMCISEAIYREYEGVLSRAKFALPSDVVAGILKDIAGAAAWVHPASSVRVCSDPDGDLFLECAIEGRAAYVVTGNTRHFPLSYGAIKVVSARALLDELGLDRP